MVDQDRPCLLAERGEHPGASDALGEQRKLQELAGSEQVGTAHITSLMQLPEEDVELTCFSESLLMTFTKYL